MGKIHQTFQNAVKNPALLAGLAGLLLIACALVVSRTSLGDSQRDGFTLVNREQNLLAPALWQGMVGAEPQESGGVRISYVGRSVAATNGRDYAPHAPVNLAGPVVVGNGTERSITIEMMDLGEAPATVRWYKGVPLLYDEWRYEVPSIAIAVTRTTITVTEWNGRSPSPERLGVHDRVLPGSTATLTVRLGTDATTVQFENTELANTPGFKLSSDDALWMGAEASAGAPWQLTGLTVTDKSGRRAPAYLPMLSGIGNDDSGSLRGLARPLNRSFRIGAAVSLEPLVSDVVYRQLAAQQFSSMTPENALKPQFIQPQPGDFHFEEADVLVAFAEKAQQVVHGHTLVFGEANPEWMTRLPLAEREAAMVDHITRVMTHFGDTISSWDVINEPLNDEGTGLRTHIWQAAMGEEYIATALRAARQAQPAAQLFINDYGLEQDGQKWTQMLALIDRLKTNGVPLDGIGFQAHIHDSDDAVDSVVLQRHFEQLAERGLTARISEVDVEGEDEDFQVDQYREVLAACLAAPNCSGVTTWGVSDRYGSTTEIQRYPLAYGNDLLFDVARQPKAAYRVWQDTLRQSR